MYVYVYIYIYIYTYTYLFIYLFIHNQHAASSLTKKFPMQSIPSDAWHRGPLPPHEHIECRHEQLLTWTRSRIGFRPADSLNCL